MNYKEGQANAEPPAVSWQPLIALHVLTAGVFGMLGTFINTIFGLGFTPQAAALVGLIVCNGAAYAIPKFTKYPRNCENFRDRALIRLISSWLGAVFLMFLPKLIILGGPIVAVFIIIWLLVWLVVCVYDLLRTRP